MGCDIHYVLEIKHTVGDEDKWLGIQASDFSLNPKAGALERNYERFAQLASVRGESSRLPRGVPDDISDLTAYNLKKWDGDGYSYSWLPIKEFVEICLSAAAEPYFAAGRKEFCQKYPIDWLFYPLGDSDDIENGRIVFWFDN